MQIKEFEAFSLKECLQQVRDEMGPDAVILETRKFQKGGMMGLGAREAICIVAATGITVQADLLKNHAEMQELPEAPPDTSNHRETARPQETPVALPQPTSAKPTAAYAAARSAYGRNGAAHEVKKSSARIGQEAEAETDSYMALLESLKEKKGKEAGEKQIPPESAPKPAATGLSNLQSTPSPEPIKASAQPPVESPVQAADPDNGRFSALEKAMGEIRECLLALQREQRESSDRTISAVVSAVAPAVTAMSASGLLVSADEPPTQFAELVSKMRDAGVSQDLIEELFDQLPDMSAWSEQAQEPLAVSALKDLIEQRVSACGGIELTAGQLKAVALIGPTGVGKTTTIAKLAAHFALVERKKVALLTVDTYRIAAVEQLKVYSQLIDVPVAVAYSNAEVLSVMAQHADYDLVLVDTAGRSQKNIMQVGELKSLLDTANCETHLVLSAQTKQADMLEAVRRFSVAGVDCMIFSKLDETSSYGTLLNVADITGIPLSYLTTGQKVPEDIVEAEGGKLANLILD